MPRIYKPQTKHAAWMILPNSSQMNLWMYLRVCRSWETYCWKVQFLLLLFSHTKFLTITYLATVLEFLGQSWKLTSHPAVPETFKIVQEIIHVASTYYYTIKYKFDCDRMLEGSVSVPTTGWMSVGEKFRTIAQEVNKEVAAMVEWESLWYIWVLELVVNIRLRINLKVSIFSAGSTVMQHCPAKASKILQNEWYCPA